MMRFGFLLLAFCTGGLIATANGAEYLKNANFDEPGLKHWSFSGQGVATCAPVLDATPPEGGAVLGFRLPGTSDKITFSQGLNLGPGRYVLSAWFDLMRLTKYGGWAVIYVAGEVDGKWKNFGGISTGDVDSRNGWRRCPWRKRSATIVVPENGKVTGVWLEALWMGGEFLLSGLSLQDAPEESAPVAAPPPPVVLLKTSGGVRSLFRENETPHQTLVVTNTASEARAFEISARTIDYFGKTVGESRDRFTLRPGEHAVRSVRLPDCTKPGFYCTALDWTAGGRKGTVESSFVRVAAPPAKPDPLFGFSCYSLSDPEVFRRLGTGTKGVALLWEWLEDRTIGELKLDDLVKRVRAFRQAGIKVTCLFTTLSVPPRFRKRGQIDKGAFPFADRAAVLAGCEQYARTVVERLKGEVTEWACSCEIDLMVRRAPYYRDWYVDLVRAISRGVRAADPSATLSALGCSGGDGRAGFPVLRDILPDIRDAIDGLAIDQYTGGQTYGEGWMTQNTEEARLREIMCQALDIAHANGLKVVSIDEKGPAVVTATPISFPGCARMADRVARDFILLKTLPEVRHWLYYKDHLDPKSFMNWGMWSGESPRHTASAYAAVARQMNGATFVRKRAFDRDLPCWLFRQDSRALATLWYNGAESIPFRLPTSPALEIRDVQGNLIRQTDGSFLLSESPVYVRARTLEELERALDGARFSIPVLRGCLSAVSGTTTLLGVRNVSAHSVTARVTSVTGFAPEARPAELSSPFALKPHETRTFAFQGAPRASTVEIGGEGLPSVTVRGAFEPRVLPRVKGWSELKALKPIVLEDAPGRMPGYADLKSNGVYTGPDDLSAVARVGYDDEALFLEIRVRDDVLAPGDSVRLLVDPHATAPLARLREEKPVLREFVFTADGKDPRATVARRNGMTGYRIRLPFSGLSPLKPRAGEVFAFAFEIRDSDGKADKVILLRSVKDDGERLAPTALTSWIIE